MFEMNTPPIKKTVILALLVSAGIFIIAKGWSDDYGCSGEGGRVLTDNEMLSLAYQYQVSERDLPEPYVSVGIEEMMQLNDNCCYVLRAEYDLNENRGVFSRAVSRPVVYASIDWRRDPSAPLLQRTGHAMTTCGEVLEAWGSFHPRKIHRNK